MKHFYRFLFVIFCFLLLAFPIQMPLALTYSPLTHYVNPFIGTTGGGNTFPGADTPFGMVQFTPYNTNSTSANTYDYNNSTIKGFAVTSLSGPGCSAEGDLPITPYIGKVTVSPVQNPGLYVRNFSHVNEQASPGYYSVIFNDGIQTRLTVTPRTGMAQFLFPSSTSKVYSLLFSNTTDNGAGKSSSIRIINKHQIEGEIEGGHFCGSKDVYHLFYVIQSKPAFSTYGTWSGATIKNFQKTSVGGNNGAYISFSIPQPQIKVGVSYVSIQDAKMNLQKENPGWNFASIQNKAQQLWNTMFSKVQVQSQNTIEKTIFYTALYHSLLFPSLYSDVNGKYMGFDGKIHTARKQPQYANFSGWDIYRSEIPLLALIVPKQTSAMMQSLVRDGEQGGTLPKWAQANGYTGVMNGDSADPILADAVAYGATQFNKNEALKLMLKNANQEPPVNNERPGLYQEQNFGYVPTSSNGQTVGSSTTLEYATDDFAIAQFAKFLGQEKTYQTFLKKSQNWELLFNPETGYLEPRNSNGTFPSNFSPTSSSGFQEGTSAQYTFMVPFNLKTDFQLMGGKAEAAKKLNSLFKQLNTGGSNTPYAWQGNEPSLGTPWEFNWTNQPWQTQETIHRILTTLYSNAPNGLPGNDDLGAMSSWYVFAALGIYPEIPGYGGYTIGSPLFSKTILHISHHRRIQLNAKKAGGNQTYIQNVTLNGKKYNKTWINFKKILKNQNTNLTFVLGENPNLLFGVKESNAPSFTSGNVPALGYVNNTQIQIKGGQSQLIHVGVRFTETSAKAQKSYPFIIQTVSGVQAIPKSGLISKKEATIRISANSILSPGVYPITIIFPHTEIPKVKVNLWLNKASSNLLIPYFNNIGISKWGETALGAFDGTGGTHASYSESAIQKAVSKTSVSTPLGNLLAGVPDNFLVSGQEISINKKAKQLLLIGAAAFGPSQGTGTIIYTDGTIQKFPLVFSDWTLNSGESSLLPGETKFATMPFRNVFVPKKGDQRDPTTTYLFEKRISVNAQKTIADIQFPIQMQSGVLHLFDLQLI